MKISLILTSLLAYAFADNLCPDEKQKECITDVNHGTSHHMKPWMSARKQPKLREKINKLISTVWSISQQWEQIAGHASAKSPLIAVST